MGYLSLYVFTYVPFTMTLRSKICKLALRFPRYLFLPFCQRRSSTPLISQALGRRTQKSLTQGSPPWPGSHTQWRVSVTDGACRERERERERERWPDWMQYTDLLQATPPSTLCLPRTKLPWWSSKCVSLGFLYQWCLKKFQGEVGPVTLSHIVLNPVFSTNFLSVKNLETQKLIYCFIFLFYLSDIFLISLLMLVEIM